MGPDNKSSMPCAACKLLRRRCTKECIFLPHFPPAEPQKFAAAHRVFGASNISKLLQEIPVNNREDAVISMVYEATARLRDPVYGCAGVVAVLQREVFWLQSELNAALAEAVALKNRLSDALPVLAHSQTYKCTSYMEENKNVNVFQSPQLMSHFYNDYEFRRNGAMASSTGLLPS